MNEAERFEKVRAFVAIFPPNPIAAELEAAQKQLQTDLAKDAVRWTTPGQIHLTMQFLGSIERERLDMFQAALEAVAGETKPLQLSAETIGCFPNSRRPRIIWAGLAGELDLLRTLKQKLDVAFAESGYVPEERRFHPHLTIGSIADLKSSDGGHLAKKISKFGAAQFGKWELREISLMQSVLSSEGAMYQVLKSFPLKTF